MVRCRSPAAPNGDISIELARGLFQRVTTLSHSSLDTCDLSPYPSLVIGFLRFVGLLNAAVWFGAAIFFTFAAGPAVFSQDMKDALRQNNPYFYGAIAQVLISRYFRLQLICGVIALLHLVMESLYL